MIITEIFNQLMEWNANKSYKSDEFVFVVHYQMEMMRNLRHVNIDHLHVGWYQSATFGSFINRALLDSQFNYQHSIEESIVIVYGKCARYILSST